MTLDEHLHARTEARIAPPPEARRDHMRDQRNRWRGPSVCGDVPPPAHERCNEWYEGGATAQLPRTGRAGDVRGRQPRQTRSRSMSGADGVHHLDLVGFEFGGHVPSVTPQREAHVPKESRERSPFLAG